MQSARLFYLLCIFRYNAPAFKIEEKGIIMFELNPIRTQLADLAERTNTLRGYL